MLQTRGMSSSDAALVLTAVMAGEPHLVTLQLAPWRGLDGVQRTSFLATQGELFADDTGVFVMRYVFVPYVSSDLPQTNATAQHATIGAVQSVVAKVALIQSLVRSYKDASLFSDMTNDPRFVQQIFRTLILQATAPHVLVFDTSASSWVGQTLDDVETALGVGAAMSAMLPVFASATVPTWLAFSWKDSVASAAAEFVALVLSFNLGSTGYYYVTGYWRRPLPLLGACAATFNSPCARAQAESLLGMLKTALLLVNSTAALNSVLGSISEGAFTIMDGFFPAVYLYNGTCVAHGWRPEEVGLSMTASNSLGNQALQTIASSGGGWLPFSRVLSSPWIGSSADVKFEDVLVFVTDYWDPRLGMAYYVLTAVSTQPPPPSCLETGCGKKAFCDTSKLSKALTAECTCQMGYEPAASAVSGLNYVCVPPVASANIARVYWTFTSFSNLVGLVLTLFLLAAYLKDTTLTSNAITLSCLAVIVPNFVQSLAYFLFTVSNLVRGKEMSEQLCTALGFVTFGFVLATFCGPVIMGFVTFLRLRALVQNKLHYQAVSLLQLKLILLLPWALAMIVASVNQYLGLLGGYRGLYCYVDNWEHISTGGLTIGLLVICSATTAGYYVAMSRIVAQSSANLSTNSERVAAIQRQGRRLVLILLATWIVFSIGGFFNLCGLHVPVWFEVLGASLLTLQPVAGFIQLMKNDRIRKPVLQLVQGLDRHVMTSNNSNNSNTPILSRPPTALRQPSRSGLSNGLGGEQAGHAEVEMQDVKGEASSITLATSPKVKTSWWVRAARAIYLWFQREAYTAPAQYSRWRSPPIAIAIQLCVGQVYAFAVFEVPLAQLKGLSSPAADDWSLSAILWIFAVAICFNGLTCAFFAPMIGKAGLRLSMACAALLWSSGLLLAAMGVYSHQIALVYLGFGVLGGCGVGFGYLCPVPFLLSWFPGRPGLVTGIAITGFGGGGIIGSPLSSLLMEHFATDSRLGVWQALVVLAVVDLVVMGVAVWTVRVPHSDWHPARGASAAKLSTSTIGLTPHEALQTPQFWLYWVIAFCAIAPALGLLANASTVVTTNFAVGNDFATGLIGLLSLANLLGRLVWSYLSDKLQRKLFYTVYPAISATCFFLASWFLEKKWFAPFILVRCIEIATFGGACATLPAALQDIFGSGRDTSSVTVIFGRCLSSWAVAGLVAPVMFNYFSSYAVCLNVLGGICVLGLLADLVMRSPCVTHPENVLNRLLRDVAMLDMERQAAMAEDISLDTDQKEDTEDWRFPTAAFQHRKIQEFLRGPEKFTQFVVQTGRADAQRIVNLLDSAIGGQVWCDIVGYGVATTLHIRKLSPKEKKLATEEATSSKQRELFAREFAEREHIRLDFEHYRDKILVLREQKALVVERGSRFVDEEKLLRNEQKFAQARGRYNLKAWIREDTTAIAQKEIELKTARDTKQGLVQPRLLYEIGKLRDRKADYEARVTDAKAAASTMAERSREQLDNLLYADMSPESKLGAYGYLDDDEEPPLASTSRHNRAVSYVVPVALGAGEGSGGSTSSVAVDLIQVQAAETTHAANDTDVEFERKCRKACDQKEILLFSWFLVFAPLIWGLVSTLQRIS